MENTLEEKGLQLDDLKVSSLPELQGWKEKQEQLVIDNPFVEIIDNKSYELACKSRTNLLKGRTSLEGQEKTIASKLAGFRKEIGAKTKELIDITEPHEDKQQQEVKRYENIKAVAKAEEERIERERIEKIEKKISDFESDSYKIIQETNIENVKIHKTMLDAFVNDGFDYEEYDIMFENAKSRVQTSWDNKCADIQEKESQRLENERMKQEIFDVRVNRLKELDIHLQINDDEVTSSFFNKSQLELFTYDEVFNMDSVSFENTLIAIKQSREQSEQARRDAELKKQKDEQFEIRKNRLLEIGFIFNHLETFSFDYFNLEIENDVYNASITEFEQILIDAKKSIADAKEQKEIADKRERIEKRKLAFEKAGLIIDKETQIYFPKSNLYVELIALYEEINDDRFEEFLSEFIQCSIELNQKLEKEAKEKADKEAIALQKKADAENKARVKRLANDKKAISEVITFYPTLLFETENQETKDFIEIANHKIESLKSDLLTQLNDL